MKSSAHDTGIRLVSTHLGHCSKRGHHRSLRLYERVRITLVVFVRSDVPSLEDCDGLARAPLLGISMILQ